MAELVVVEDKDVSLRQYAGLQSPYARIARLCADETMVHDFANSFGSYDTAWVRPFPYWVDTRAVGMYAGQVYRDYAIQAPDVPATTADPRAKLFILHLRDAQGVRPDGEPATLPVLRQLYPDGRLSLYHSARPDRDFLVFFIPAQPELGEPTFSTP